MFADVLTFFLKSLDGPAVRLVSQNIISSSQMCETAESAWRYPVPQATSSTLRTPCCFSRDTSQLLYSCVLLCRSPMYSSHTLAALPSAYWSGRPSAATPRDRVRNTLSTDMLPLVPAGVSRELTPLNSQVWKKCLVLKTLSVSLAGGLNSC